MPSREKLIIIFTRYPKPGHAKTRLLTILSPTEAARLQQLLTEHTIAQAESLCRAQGPTMEIHYQGGTQQAMHAWLGNHRCCLPQAPGNLGEKMARAFEEAFQRGFQQVVLIGSDCPALTPEIIDTALEQLATNDLVLGPASDGGYYLIGMNTSHPGLFTAIPWGGATVLTATTNLAIQAGLTIARLAELPDIDRPADLHDPAAAPFCLAIE